MDLIREKKNKAYEDYNNKIADAKKKKEEVDDLVKLAAKALIDAAVKDTPENKATAKNKGEEASKASREHDEM